MPSLNMPGNQGGFGPPKGNVGNGGTLGHGGHGGYGGVPHPQPQPQLPFNMGQSQGHPQYQLPFQMEELRCHVKKPQLLKIDRYLSWSLCI